MNVAARDFPFDEPQSLKEIAGRGWDVFKGTWHIFIVAFVVAIGVPILMQDLVWANLFPEGGVDLGDDLVGVFASVWWSVGVETSASLVLRIAESYFVLSLIAGVGTLVTAARLHNTELVWRDILNIAFVLRGLQLFVAHFIVSLLVFGLTLFTILGTCICIGVFGTPLTIFLLTGWVPFLSPVLLLERGPYSRLLSRAWYLGKKSIWVNIRVIIACLVLTVALNTLTGQLLKDNTDLSNLIQQLTTYGVWTIEIVLFSIIYYDARLRYDSEEAIEAVSIGRPIEPPEPTFTRDDRRTVLRIMYYFGLVLVGSVALIAVLIIGWLVINQQEIIASIEQFGRDLQADPDFQAIVAVIQFIRDIANPNTYAELESLINELSSLMSLLE